MTSTTNPFATAEDIEQVSDTAPQDTQQVPDALEPDTGEDTAVPEDTASTPEDTASTPEDETDETDDEEDEDEVVTPEQAIAQFDEGTWSHYDETSEELEITTGGWPFTDMWFEIAENDDDGYRWSYGESGSHTTTLDSGSSSDRDDARDALRASFEAKLHDGTISP